MSGSTTKVLTIGKCQTCGSVFEYMRGASRGRAYCSEACRKRMKVIYEKARQCKLGIRKPTKTTRGLIPYAGKE